MRRQGAFFRMAAASVAALSITAPVARADDFQSRAIAVADAYVSAFKTETLIQFVSENAPPGTNAAMAKAAGYADPDAFAASVLAGYRLATGMFEPVSARTFPKAAHWGQTEQRAWAVIPVETRLRPDPGAPLPPSCKGIAIIQVDGNLHVFPANVENMALVAPLFPDLPDLSALPVACANPVS